MAVRVDTMDPGKVRVAVCVAVWFVCCRMFCCKVGGDVRGAVRADTMDPGVQCVLQCVLQ